MANFFQTTKPKGFHIQPRYWDPEKEKREQRDRRIKSEMGITDENGSSYKPYIGRGAFKQGMSKGRWVKNSQRRKSNIRLLVIVALLALLVFFILK